MSETPKSHPGGLPPGFSISNQLNDPSVANPEWSDHDAFVAAQRVWDKLNNDPKTGLLRQEAWMEGLSQAVEARRDDQAIVVRVFDLDGFKAINDQLGHAAGDKLLAIAGEAVGVSFKRQSDAAGHGSRENSAGVARLGGDEYAVYEVIDTDPSDSNRVVQNALDNDMQSQRVNETFQKLLAPTEFAGFGLKLSMGTEALQLGETAEDVFARADYGMFVVKYDGKIDQLTEEDKKQLRDYIIPHLRRIGARVESWLEEAADQAV